jgi:RHS repeat-associated protein
VFGEAVLSGSVSTVYDGLGRVATRDGVVFGYSGLGQDVINDGTTVFGRSLSGGPVSSKTAVSGSLRWLVGDQHGDVVGLVMPATGVMSSTVGFDPWGVVTGRSGVGLSVAGFQGDWTDPVSGVVDMEARGYSPLLGTFTSRDLVSGSVSSPLSMNRFGYGEGDPVNHSDPSGHSIASILAVATGAVSAGASAVVGATPQGQATDFFYTVEAQQSLDVFNNIPRPGAPDVNGSEDAYRAAVDANRLYRMLQMDVWFRLVAVGKGDPSAYGSNQKDREQAIADNDKAYVFLAAVAWHQAHPAPVALPSPTPKSSPPPTTPNGGKVRKDYRCPGFGNQTMIEAANYAMVNGISSETDDGKPCDSMAQLAWSYMGLQLQLFNNPCLPTTDDCLARLIQYGVQSQTDWNLDPKPRLRELWDSEYEFFTGNGPDEIPIIDLGDPDYLFYYDVIGNAIWGAMTQMLWHDLLSREMVLDFQARKGIIDNWPVAVFINTGADDPGDGISVAAGWDAAAEYGKDLTLDQLLKSVRASIPDYLAYSNGVLSIPNLVAEGVNHKLVFRDKVNHR